MVTSPPPTYTIFPLGQTHPTLEPSVVPTDAGGAPRDDRAQGCQQPPTCWSKRSSLQGCTCPAHSRIATIPHSVTQDHACRVCLQHSSPGPGNGLGHEVPPAFFFAPAAWEAVRLQTALERSCHQRDRSTAQGPDAGPWGGHSGPVAGRQRHLTSPTPPPPQSQALELTSGEAEASFGLAELCGIHSQCDVLKQGPCGPSAQPRHNNPQHRLSSPRCHPSPGM